MAELGTRLHRFLFETERQIPKATGESSALLSQLHLLRDDDRDELPVREGFEEDR